MNNRYHIKLNLSMNWLFTKWRGQISSWPNIFQTMSVGKMFFDQKSQNRD